jgi:hypothetical protein
VNRERGFVFAAVAAVLVIAAALLSGAFFFALQEERLGRGAQASLRALAAAEAGAARAIAAWSPAREGALLPGDSLSLAATLPAGAGTATVTISAWGEQFMLVTSRGVDPTGVAAREIARIVRLAPPYVEVPAALATARLAGGWEAYVSEFDSVLAGWRCPAPRAVPRLARLAQPWSDWYSLAAVAVPGSSLPTAANPVVLVSGSADFIGGSGQGILLVDGDATFAAGTELVGLLVVRGRFELIGTGGRVIGAVRADTIAALSSALSGSAVIWSSCAVARALRAAARPRAVAPWGWGDLSGGW